MVFTSSGTCAAASTWNGWITLYNTSAGTSVTTTDAVWLSWSDNSTTNGISWPVTAVWQAWNQRWPARTHRGTAATTRVYAPPQLSAEQQRQIAAQRAERDATYQRLQAEEAEAKNKAEKLLVEHLTPPQRESLRTHGYFDVQVAGKTYRIRRGQHGNVRLLDGAREKYSYCIQPEGYCPDADAMLAQKFLLENDEAAFLRIANRSAC